MQQTQSLSRCGFSSCAAAAVLLVFVLAVTGCASGSGASAPVETSNSPEEENIDPTAMHLHDVAGRLLLFVAKFNRLPAKLSDLEPIPGDDGKASAIDPATGEAFAYTPNGIKPDGLPGRLLVYQAVTKQPGSRWALLFNDRLRETRVQRAADSVLKHPLN